MLVANLIIGPRIVGGEFEYQIGTDAKHWRRVSANAKEHKLKYRFLAICSSTFF